MKPLCIDLFCGLGGWAEGFVAEGYRVVGFDIDGRFAGPYRKAGGEFVLADVRALDGRRFRNARCFVMSPPCREFGSLRWALNPELRKVPDMTLWDAGIRVARQADRPWVLENVQGARRWRPGCRAHFGPYYLWGDVSLIPQARYGFWKKDIYRMMRKASGMDTTEKRDRLASRAARIPLPLARAVARGFL